MLIFVSLVLALGVSLYWIADAVADILQARRLEKSMESIVNILKKGLDLEKSIGEHEDKNCSSKNQLTNLDKNSSLLTSGLASQDTPINLSKVSITRKNTLKPKTKVTNIKKIIKK